LGLITFAQIQKPVLNFFGRMFNVLACVHQGINSPALHRSSLRENRHMRSCGRAQRNHALKRMGVFRTVLANGSPATGVSNTGSAAEEQCLIK
jgi:hypothetical protein